MKNPLFLVVTVIWILATIGTLILKNSDPYILAAITSVLFGVGYLIYKKGGCD